ncbi:MAG: ferrous iron transport protein B [Phycisphaerae bacterium]|nr:ferrous iron transport protein B [Phycisphaerae bacterium]
MVPGDSLSTNAARGEPKTRAAVVALVGNPNTGKTALFNALTGFRRHVANYPGVTVDVARGRVRKAIKPIELLDLPGSYSLAAASPDEMILCNALWGYVEGEARPEAILAIVDASNLQRNLYLISQLLEVGLPLVIALNMIDVAKSKGIEIDAERLSERLGVPVLPVVAIRTKTVEPLVAALEAAIEADPPTKRVELPEALRQETLGLHESADHIGPGEALRILMDQDGCAEKQFIAQGGCAETVSRARERLRAAGIDVGPAEVRARYAWINNILDGVIHRRLQPGKNWSDRIDRVLTHRIGGAVVLLVVLYCLFYMIYAGSGPLMDAVEGFFGWLGGLVGGLLPDGVIKSLLVDGIVNGVGGVLSFLPQILILFLFIAILEDCGYLSRAAFMVDRLMRPLGLSGRAFIPLLSSFACAVPAIMGTRAIADRRERFITILIAPFMSCSARLPVYVLMIGAFVDEEAVWLGGWLRLDALVMLAMYLVGVVFAIPIALLLKKVVFAGPPAGFLMELPTYKLPRLRTVFQRVYLGGHSFVVRAGTIILIVNVVVWALAYFPRSDATRNAVEQEKIAQSWGQESFEAELAGAYLRDSYLGRMGRGIEPVIKPLGWDWRVGVGVLASFPAREVIIATLGTVLNLGAESEAASTSLRAAVKEMTWADTGKPVFTLPVALSVMVFFALCAQCSATLVVIGKEMGSWLWSAASFVGMTTLAYLAAWGVYAGARALGM